MKPIFMKCPIYIIILIDTRKRLEFSFNTSFMLLILISSIKGKSLHWLMPLQDLEEHFLLLLEWALSSLLCTLTSFSRVRWLESFFILHQDFQKKFLKRRKRRKTKTKTRTKLQKTRTELTLIFMRTKTTFTKKIP